MRRPVNGRPSGAADLASLFGRPPPADSVCDPSGQVWDTPGLYVCDGAAFPTASGVNPMVTIEALAHMNARGLAAKLA